MRLDLRLSELGSLAESTSSPHLPSTRQSLWSRSRVKLFLSFFQRIHEGSNLASLSLTYLKFYFFFFPLLLRNSRQFPSVQRMLVSTPDSIHLNAGLYTLTLQTTINQCPFRPFERCPIPLATARSRRSLYILTSAARLRLSAAECAGHDSPAATVRHRTYLACRYSTRRHHHARCASLDCPLARASGHN